MTHSSLLPALAVNIETPSLAGSAGGYLVFDDATYGKFDTGTFAPLGGYQKDQVAKTRQVNIKRGDSSPTDVMFHAQTGTASVTLDNRTRTFDPVSNTDVRPMRGINITATWSAVTYDLFTGFVTDWNETYPASGKDAITSAQCADGSYLLVNANVTDTFPVESTGARVNELLNLAEWPQVLRAVEAGSIQMHASIPTGSAWSAMQEAADSEMGDLYVAADGTMTFRASTSLVSDSRSTTSQATFGDTGAELPYSDVVLSYDTKRIHNTVSVSYNEAGDVVYQSDAVSLNAYGPSAFNVQAAINDKTSAQHLADFIINLYSQPLIRVDSLVLKPARSPSTLWPQALGLEIGDRITVKLTPPGGGSRVSRDGWVRGIEHQITADGDWTTTFTLQDVSNLASYIIFDTSVFDGTDQFWF